MAPTTTERKNNLLRRIGYIKEIIALGGVSTPKGEVEAAQEMLGRLELSLEALRDTSPTGWNEAGTHYYSLPERWYGSKCDRNNYVPLTEINKLIRAEIKNLRSLGKKIAKQAGTEVSLYGADAFGSITDMPAFIKVSVSKRDSAIYITLKDVPADWWEDATDMYGHAYRKPVKQLQDLANALHDLMAQYRYDGTDAQVDYFDTNFHPRVQAMDTASDWSYARSISRSRY